jgi:hypothetical protein
MANALISEKQINVNRATGAHFYKYSAFTGKRRDWLKDLILNHHFYAPTVKELADPSEAKPKLSPQSETACMSFCIAVHLVFWDAIHGCPCRNKSGTGWCSK